MNNRVKRSAPSKEENVLRSRMPLDLGNKLHRYSEKRSLIRVEKSDEEWRFQLEGWTEGGHSCREWRIIEHLDGSPIGFLSYHNETKSGGFGVHQIELAPDRGYLQFLPGISRQLWNEATDLNQGKPPSEIKLYLGQEHPAYQPILHRTQIEKGELQCLYIRVQDIVSFLRHITPALEKNLAESPACGFTGTLQITMFRNGIEIAIDSGRITGIDAWKADSLWHAPAFPELTFLQLVFGRRRCKELSDIYVDCNLDDHSALVLDSLFPPFKGTMWLGN